MSFRATIEIDGKTHRLLQCKYALSRGVDKTGRPSAEPQGGKIEFTIESSDENLFYEWMIDRYAHKNGSIRFYRRDQDSTMKELSFEDGYLIAYAEDFEANGEAPMTQRLTISAKKISISGASLTNPWPDV